MRLLLFSTPLSLVGVVLSQPIATTLNGSYSGLHLPDWNQDAFLGIPFAQPPLGDLRYRHPRSLNKSFVGCREAKSYGYSCMQYNDQLNMSEDCLTLNVVRPANSHPNPLPVLVWIYGGGLGVGATADPQYNMSGIVKVSQDIKQPVIAVSLNYRVNHWGFLQSHETLVEGSSNAGLLDQRLAFRWIQENIAAFGGDPGRVVLWGESAGAQSITYHMLSYDGRDDGLFHGAILESGGPTGCPVKDLSYWTVPFENLTRSVGCYSAQDRLSCLRDVDGDKLLAARQSQEWQGPLIDGEFLTGYPSQLLPQGKFIKVPLLTGANTDEGISFNPSYPPKADSPLLETDKDLFDNFLAWRSYDLSPSTIKALLQLYPLDSCDQPPHSISNCSIFPDMGRQWRRAASIGGDMVMIAGRRKMCEVFSSANQPVFSYRFDTRLWNRTELEGVMHFDNVAFSFQNISGLLGPWPEYDGHRQLSRGIGRAYIRFVHSFDPNAHEDTNDTDVDIPYWPPYSLSNPINMVLNASGSYLESDTYRREGIAFLNSPQVSRELLG
ncbi:lipase [Thelonectria olida]|uniref:Carboxylic ester hydrolase n=1 Tax=Thelonectria olida TaxID=1576542 RepID=A0A9P8VN87_9HYPO|nr:lipase [Thelonectria olida]